LLDANNVPLTTDRGRIWSVSYPSNATISNVKMLKAILKQTSPSTKYRLYFDDGSIGDATYSGGRATGTITATSPKGSAVMPIGTKFHCGILDNSNVTADAAFTPVLPPVIRKYF
jgi:hypothetical protein